MAVLKSKSFLLMVFFQTRWYAQKPDLHGKSREAVPCTQYEHLPILPLRQCLTESLSANPCKSILGSRKL